MMENSYHYGLCDNLPKGMRYLIRQRNQHGALEYHQQQILCQSKAVQENKKKRVCLNYDQCQVSAVYTDAIDLIEREPKEYLGFE